MAARFKAGDEAYIIESNQWVKKVRIIRYSGGIYLIRFENGGGIRVKEHRLYETEELANAAIEKAKAAEKKPVKYRSPYDYDH